MYRDFAALVIEHLVVADRPVFCAGEVLWQSLAVGLDGSKARHLELLGTSLKKKHSVLALKLKTFGPNIKN